MTTFDRLIWLQFVSGPRRISELVGDFYTPAVTAAVQNLAAQGFLRVTAADYGHELMCEALIPAPRVARLANTSEAAPV